ncbi:hypothetical protein [Flavobacterium undicola]|uniref:hypothetical protein n=1 Tax=Flavobacterium undicola TaxID=1932779 RepID=UPI0013789B37|nr:hypothetical protein [Flavobacterium undicola]MBA0882731.1 hypothetical protein [Flavobacterium undicola]
MIEFNENYEEILIHSSYYKVLVKHIEELYPLVYQGLCLYSFLEQYVEPKIVEVLKLEFEYRKQNYPLSGCTELAYKDICDLINDELEEYEREEYLKQFDLDLNPVIDTECI